MTTIDLYNSIRDCVENAQKCRIEGRMEEANYWLLLAILKRMDRDLNFLD